MFIEFSLLPHSAYTKRICGRYRRKSDKQRIAEAFAVQAGLDETCFDPGDGFSLQSMQLVIYFNENGQRKIEMMRWAFKAGR